MLVFNFFFSGYTMLQLYRSSNFIGVS